MKKIIDKMTTEYLNDMLVRLAHHSSAIEGNTLSLNDTISIILDSTVPGNTSVREFYEIENHKQTLDYIISCLYSFKELDLTIVKKINYLLLDHLNEDRGNFKSASNAIVGADFETAAPEQTSTLMYQWINNLKYRLENSDDEEEKIKVILESHIQFERIHPFSDGNGRTGRLLILYSLIENNIAPLLITKELKNEYMINLREQDVDNFYKMSKPLIEKEYQRIECFYNKEKTKLK